MCLCVFVDCWDCWTTHSRSIMEALRRNAFSVRAVDSSPMNTRLLQSVKNLAESRGHHFIIFSVSASKMVEIAWSLIEASYYVRLRRVLPRASWPSLKSNKSLKFDRVKAKCVPDFPEFAPDGVTPMEYNVGWHVVPSYMPGLRKHLHPVSALDGAFCKSPAQGTFTVEVTVDGLSRLHPVGIQHALSAENTWGYDHYFEGTKEAYHEEDIDSKANSVNGDGAHALRGSLSTWRKKAAYSACHRHLLQHKTKSTVDIAHSIMHKPPIKRHEVLATIHYDPLSMFHPRFIHWNHAHAAPTHMACLYGL